MKDRTLTACVWGKASWDKAWEAGPAQQTEEDYQRLLGYADHIWKLSLTRVHGITYSDPRQIQSYYDDYGMLDGLRSRNRDLFWALYKVFPVCGVSNSVYWPGLDRMAKSLNLTTVRKCLPWIVATPWLVATPGSVGAPIFTYHACPAGHQSG